MDSGDKYRHTSLASARRKQDSFWLEVLRGKGLDIGAGGDCLAGAESFDVVDGDAGDVLSYRVAGSYDFVYASHVLEHMRDPGTALAGWWALVKPGGWLVVVVPDEDLYEQGVWPSRFDQDHKATFTIFKDSSWSPVSRNLRPMLESMPNGEVVRCSIVDTGYDYSLSGVNQSDVAECDIEAVVRKVS